jgi:hypothetical protein
MPGPLALPYRTLLGHFRHEIGHYYWDRLVRDGGNIENCRGIFGDESNDYETALKRYYAEGAPAAWQQSFVSATLETARAFGICITPEVGDDDVLHVKSR